MAVKLVPVLALLAAGAVTAPPDTAEACRRACGRVRVHVPPFGVRVGWPPAHIVIRGPIVRYGYEARTSPPPPPPPEAPEPPPPPPPRGPAYVEHTPPPRYEEAEAPPTQIYRTARPRERNIGVGLRASAMQVGRNGPTASGVGALLRFRSRPVELELEVGRDTYNDLDRDDTRVGASLYVPLTQTSLVPFLVAGAGVNFSYFGHTGDQLYQGYLGAGGGLSLKLGSRFIISADARYFMRRFFDDEMVVAAQSLAGSSGDPAGVRDEGVEGRLVGVLYF